MAPSNIVQQHDTDETHDNDPRLLRLEQDIEALRARIAQAASRVAALQTLQTPPGVE